MDITSNLIGCLSFSSIAVDEITTENPISLWKTLKLHKIFKKIQSSRLLKSLKIRKILYELNNMLRKLTLLKLRIMEFNLHKYISPVVVNT